MRLHYHYDKEADVLYFSQGKPSAQDTSEEAGDDVVLRLNPRTRVVRGFTLLNVSKHSSDGASVPLPISAKLAVA